MDKCETACSLLPDLYLEKVSSLEKGKCKENTT